MAVAIKPRRDPTQVSSELSKSRHDLTAFIETSRAAMSGQDVHRSLGAILDGAMNLLDADEGSIMMLDASAGGLRITTSRGLSEEVRRNTLVPKGRGIAGYVLKHGRPLLLPSPLDVSRFEAYAGKSRQISSALCVPLRTSEGVIGVLNLNLVRPSRLFRDEDLQVASLFAEHAALAISTAELIRRTSTSASELSSLHSAATRLGKSLQLDTVVDAALTEGLAFCGSSHGLLVLGTHDRVELARYRGISRDGVRHLLRRPDFLALLSKSDGASIYNVASGVSVQGLAGEIGGKNLVVAPLVSSEGSAGGLLAVAVPWSEAERTQRLLSAYSIEAGMAIANAALHEQVRVKEHELSSIVEAMPNPIILVDQRGMFRAINPTAAETFHLGADFEIGRPAKGRLGDVVEGLLFADADATREVLLTVGGEARVWRATVTTTRSAPVAGGRLLVLDDITTQRELEQRKADFLAVIGHELRTPLTIISGFASTLVRKDTEITPDVRQRCVDSIADQSQRLGEMIEDLLYVSRIENKTPPLHLSWSDVTTSANDAVEAFRRRFPDRAFTVQNLTSSANLLMDRIKIEQVLRHLIDNALKYSEPNTPVTLVIDDADEDVRLTVIDKGQGIFSGDIPRLFRVFGQLDSSSTRRHGGTGVGLSVCKILVEAMGGRIWARSMLGKGSEFSFTVPRTPPESEIA